MVSSSQTPGTSVYNWNLESTSSSLAATTNPTRKYCSACSSCQRSRVKCSGGTPCKRCESQGAACTYKPSMRNGRLRIHNQTRQQTPDTSSLSHSPSLLNPWPTTMPAATGTDMGLADIIHPSPPPTINPANFFESLTPPCLPSDVSTMLQPIGSLSMPDALLQTPIITQPGADKSSRPASASAPRCHCLHMLHEYNSQLGNATRFPETKCRFDEVLQLMRDSCTHIPGYLACPECSAGCVRLMNAVILYQLLMNLLCKITKEPDALLRAPGNIKLGVGVFQLSEKEDICHKRLLLLSAAKAIDGEVRNFDDLIRDYQDQEIAGTPNDSLTESARINLKWLLDSTRSLRARIRTITAIMEAPEFGVQAKS